MSFRIFKNRETPFYAIKTKSPKDRKIGIFPKGLSHGFGPKMAIFLTQLFRQFRPGKFLCDILKRKNAFLRYKNKNSKEPKNLHFSKGVNPWFWSKNGHFSDLFFKQFRKGKCLLPYSRKKKLLFTL